MAYHPETKWVRDTVRRWKDAETPFSEKQCEKCGEETEYLTLYDGKWHLCDVCCVAAKEMDEEDSQCGN